MVAVIVYGVLNKYFRTCERRHRKHQKPVEGFFRSARVMLKDQYGEIHVTHKMVHSFKEWRILVLGFTFGFRCHREVEINACNI